MVDSSSKWERQVASTVVLKILDNEEGLLINWQDICLSGGSPTWQDLARKLFLDLWSRSEWRETTTSIFRSTSLLISGV